MNGSRKGSSFERLIAKRLSLWWSNNMADDWFWRTAGSGARATVRARSGKTTESSDGDIAPQNEEAAVLTNKWFIEVKHYKNLGLDNLIVGRPSELRKMWEKTKKQATSRLKQPMMIVRQNRTPILLIVGTSTAYSIMALMFNQPVLSVVGDMRIMDFDTFQRRNHADYCYYLLAGKKRTNEANPHKKTTIKKRAKKPVCHNVRSSSK